ncbi:MAG: hypothetical protein DSY82_06940 [Flavobacteriia bacterium]|nr:MAG: hypothetical protein DSY82_06940 [Flavobacteriia bacterium]
MKKSILFLFLTLLISIYSCKKEEKKVENKDAGTKAMYTVLSKDVKINWTGYKTTEKIPVKGTFKEVEILNAKAAESPEKAINNLKFKIPVASIFSKDSIRDYKLVNFLFGNMKNTLSIQGKITLDENNKGTATLSLNGLEKEVPVTYTLTGDNIHINTSIDLNNWQAQAAVKALNDVCSEKHKSKDGISKTWSDVGIDVDVKLTKK